MDSVESQVLDLVARLNPGPFSLLHRYFGQHQDFLDPAVTEFDRGCQFYLAYLDFIELLRADGLGFCYPALSSAPGRVRAQGAFDLALAASMPLSRTPGRGVVTNDFDLSPTELIVVVTGPNNGGKTTFARAFGQLHYLASLGLPVPAQEAELVLADGVFTSFQQAERLGTLRSHLEEELVHIHHIIEQASPRSIIVMNESFSSTTLRDAAVRGPGRVRPARSARLAVRVRDLRRRPGHSRPETRSVCPPLFTPTTPSAALTSSYARPPKVAPTPPPWRPGTGSLPSQWSNGWPDEGTPHGPRPRLRGGPPTGAGERCTGGGPRPRLDVGGDGRWR